MTTATRTRPAVDRDALRASPRRLALMTVVDWLVDRDSAYRQGRQMQRLSAAERRDMGLAPVAVHSSRAAERLLLHGQW